MKSLLLAFYFSCIFLLTGCENNAGQETRQLYLVPYPQNVSFGSGYGFDVSSIALGVLPNAGTPGLVSYLRSELDVLVPGAVISAETLNVLLHINPDLDVPSKEGYEIRVTDKAASLVGKSGQGLFYAANTFAQLAHQAHQSDGKIPAVTITDSPRFPYRGLHLDVGRHMFPVEFIKKYIDNLARLKLNTFHWHLTEDQGWRIEIKKYPKLTEVGSKRKETILERNFDPYIGDGTPYGGYYTRDEIREVVAHAQSRFVTIIPEIEMPGHSTAAIASYPELGCTGEQLEVESVWGVHEQGVYCPTEETFSFLEDVLAEVIDLFPGEYIHIGGDEAPKTVWENSPIAQDVIAREGLADEHELQSYFIKRIEDFLISKGRRLIGWDEILEGGLAPEATVMSWRGVKGGIEAAHQGHEVIMTPTTHLYFDYYQGEPESEPLAIGGDLPLEKVYSFEPIPEELAGDAEKLVLGAQGNVWTEYMKTSDHVEYMAFPRACALAEVVWTPKDRRNWADFRYRMEMHQDRLALFGVNARKLD